MNKIDEEQNYNFFWSSCILCSIVCVCWFLFPNPLVPVFLGLIPIGIIIVIYCPVHMCLMFIIFSFFRIHEAIPILYPLHIPFLLSIATILSVTWHIFLSKEIKPYGRPEMYAFLVFFIIVFIGVPFASNRTIAMDYIQSTYIKIAIMIPVLIWCIREIKHFKMTLLMFTSAGLIIGFVAIYNKINKIGLVEGTRVTIGRDIGSVIGDPNDLSLVLLMPFSYAISMLITKRTAFFYRLIGFVTTITLFSAIIATQSRGGILGILAVFGMIGYQHIKSKTLLFAIGGVFSSAMFIFAGISGRQSGGAAEAGIDESAMGRIHAWEAAIGMAMDNPITGVGIENFLNNYWFYTPSWDGKNHVVHSTWFGVLAETGFVGLIVFLTMVIVVFKASISTLRIVNSKDTKFHPVVCAMSTGNFYGLLCFCVSGTFLTQSFTWPFYIIMGLTVSVAQFVKIEQSKIKT
tara:strand:- start:167 stop:1546 length:1380 start_codon:yes stop_codon:yes gene_type:complete